MLIFPRDRIQATGTPVANPILFQPERQIAGLQRTSAKTWVHLIPGAARATHNPYQASGRPIFISTPLCVHDTLVKNWISSVAHKTKNQLSSWFWGLRFHSVAASADEMQSRTHVHAYNVNNEICAVLLIYDLESKMDFSSAHAHIHMRSFFLRFHCKHNRERAYENKKRVKRPACRAKSETCCAREMRSCRRKMYETLASHREFVVRESDRVHDIWDSLCPCEKNIQSRLDMRDEIYTLVWDKLRMFWNRSLLL
jgi:hypothetical protein